MEDILLLDFDYYKKFLKDNSERNPFNFISINDVDSFDNIGLLIKIKPEIKDKMIILPQEYRLDFILSQKFFDSIIDWTFIKCNKNKKSITLNCNNFILNNLDNILNCLFENFPHNFKIILSVEIGETGNYENFNHIVNIICSTFSYPILSGLDHKIYFFRINDFGNNINCKTTKLLIQKMVKEIEKEKTNPIINCSVKVRLTNSAIKKLKLLTSKIFESENHFEGLEISDKFTIQDISPLSTLQISNEKIEDEMVVTLCINENDSKIGEDDSVDVVYSKYTYHTHPKKTYDKFEVLYAWPSWQDFESFLILFKSGVTIFHITSTLEGAYITTINPEIIHHLSNWDFNDITEIIKSNYDWIYPSYDIERKKDNHLHPKNGQDFCEQINKLEVEFHKEIYPPIFKVELVPWNEFTEDKIFHVDYLSGTNQTCAISDIQYL